MAASSSMPAAAPPGCACCSRAAMAVILRVVAWSLPKISCKSTTVLPRMRFASAREPVVQQVSHVCRDKGFHTRTVTDN